MSSRVVDVEAALAADPLAARLAGVAVSPVPERLRANVMLGVAVTAHRRGGGRVQLRSGAFAALGAAVLAMCVLAVTPAGASLARAILPDGMQQRLGIVEGAPQVLNAPGTEPAHALTSMSPIPCSQVQQMMRTPRPGGGILCFPDLPFAAVQAQVEFRIPTPSALPAGLIYRAGLVNSVHSAYLTYGRTAGQPGVISLTVTDRTPIGGPAVPSGSAQHVQVDGGTGYAVRGDYGDNGPGTPVRWNPNADDLELTWQHGGLTFDLTAAGLHFSVADLVRVAESIR